MTDNKKQSSVAEGLRLNKAMAQCGLCSRRVADEWIMAGRVLVNSTKILEPGLRLMHGDKLSVDGKQVAWEGLAVEKYVYLMLNKPVQVVSTAKDPEGRQTVLDFIPKEYQSLRLYPVGRLDYFSEGLLILTNDGDLTHKLTHPKFHLSKKYLVTVREEPQASVLNVMCEGMTLQEGEKLAPALVKYIGHTEPGAKTEGHVLEFTLHQGINRQVRRMCRDSNLTILKLQRVSQGPIKLGELKSGNCRVLNRIELNSLLQAIENPRY